MKLLKVFTATTFTAFALVASARAQANDQYHNDPLNGFYANAGAGFNFMPDMKSSAPGANFKTSMDVGSRISLAVGYMAPLAKSTSIGLEFETGALVNALNHASISGPTPGTASLDGFYYQVPILVNGVLVCRAVPCWSFYAGIGGGGVYSSFDLHEFNGVSVDSQHDEMAGAFQAMGGVRYQIAPNQEVGIGYKYLAVFVNDVQLGNNTATVYNHSVMATYTFHF